MPSYQDIETRLRIVEEKIDFVMKSFQVMKQSPIHGFPPYHASMLDLYLESRQAGLIIEGTARSVDSSQPVDPAAPVATPTSAVDLPPVDPTDK